MEKITTKGIPVISVEEGGEIIQHAEIERDEVILEITLSKKIRKNYITMVLMKPLQKLEDC